MRNANRIMNCRSCGERMFFAETAGGAYMPINVEPDDGNLKVTFRGNQVPRVDVVKQGEKDQLNFDVDVVYGFTSHYVNCPQAKKHRRG